MAKEPNISFDPATGKVVELVPQEVNDDSFQIALDEAQNRLNTAKEVVPSKESEYAEAVEAVEAKSLELEDARKEVELAEEEVAFQNGRKAQFDEAVRVRNEQSQSTPESEFAEDPSTAVDIPVTVVAEAAA